MAKDDVRRRSHQGDVRRRRDAYDRHRSARSATSPVHVVHRPCATSQSWPGSRPPGSRNHDDRQLRHQANPG